LANAKDTAGKYNFDAACSNARNGQRRSLYRRIAQAAPIDAKDIFRIPKAEAILSRMSGITAKWLG
jgi:hypothetical protein